MSDMDAITFGKMQAEVEQLQKDVAELKTDMKELLSLANKSKGGFWMALTAASAFSALLTFIVSHLPFMKT